VSELQHLDGSAKAAPDVSCELIAEHGQLFAIRRADVRGNCSVRRIVATARSEEKQFGEAGCAEPGKSAVVIHASKREAPVAIDPMQSDVGGFETLTRHRFHGIAVDGVDDSNFNSQGQPWGGEERRLTAKDVIRLASD